MLPPSMTHSADPSPESCMASHAVQELAPAEDDFPDSSKDALKFAVVESVSIGVGRKG